MKIRSSLASLKSEPKQTLKRWAANGINFVIDAAISGAKAAWRSTVSLWNNLETVGILTLAGLGASHFIGEICVEHAALSALLVSELISPVIAVGGIYGLLKLSQWRKTRRLTHGLA